MSTNILTKQNKQNPQSAQTSFQELIQEIKAKRNIQRNQIKAMKKSYHVAENPQNVVHENQDKQKKVEDSNLIAVHKQYKKVFYKEQEDEPIINIKERSINGRDHLKVKIKSKTKFLSANKQQIKTTRYNANKDNNPDKPFKFSPQKIEKKKYLLLNQSTFLPKLNENYNQLPISDESLHDIVTASQILNQKQKQRYQKMNFKQKKLNSMLAKSVKIVDINQEKLQAMLLNQSIDQNAQAKQIFGFFSQLCDRVGAYLEFPLIKKYRNCVYFGQPIIHNCKYEGFLYYFDRKFYYGQFQNGQRNGKGTQINLVNNTITKGIFKEGLKTGYFNVKKYEENYSGFLENGFYHGKGKLTTKDSIYQGQFRNGLKSGIGAQFFFKNGVKLEGKFIDGYFDPKSLAEGSFNNDKPNLRFNKQALDAKFPDAVWKQAFSRSIDYQKKAHMKKYSNNNFSQSEPSNFNNFNQKQYSSQNNFYPNIKITEANKSNRLQQIQHNFDPRYLAEDQFVSDLNRVGNQNSSHLPKIQERIQTSQHEDPLPVPQFKGK